MFTWIISFVHCNLNLGDSSDDSYFHLVDFNQNQQKQQSMFYLKQKLTDKVFPINFKTSSLHPTVAILLFRMKKIQGRSVCLKWSLDLPLKNKSSQEMQGSFHSLQPCGKRKQVTKVLYCHVSEILLKRTPYRFQSP